MRYRELRAYVFTNMYLSSIQNGIQAAHCLVAMANKYRDQFGILHPQQRDMYWDWAHNHKTLILCNGGNNADLIEIKDSLAHFRLHLPTGYFHEDEVSMGGMLTAVGVIVPDFIYNEAEAFRKSKGPFSPSPLIGGSEFALVKILASKSLAK